MTLRVSGGVEPQRLDGYAPIRDYAAIGDGHTVALVALDGAVDWLCAPGHDSDPVFDALLDAEAGGAFELRPDEPARVARAYRHESNVLETTFESASGIVRVVDAMGIQDGGALPWREVIRSVECLSGSVPMRFAVRVSARTGCRVRPIGESATILDLDRASLAVLSWDGGRHVAGGRGVEGSFRIESGAAALFTVVHVAGGPVPVSTRDEVEQRLDGTTRAWRRWLRQHVYDGPWRSEVIRSLLALKLLISTPSGAIAAAPTTSLPERIGGERNWDYRYAWPRDSCLTMMALIRAGFREQAHSSFAWLLDTVARTHPDVRPVYRLDGATLDGEGKLDVPGYRGSRPVRVGNRAGAQRQLGGYGDLLDTAWAYVDEGNVLDRETGRRLAAVADRVCELWRQPDSGIWELEQERHFTQSKIAGWTGLRRALDLAAAGQLPSDRVRVWRRELAAIERYVESECWSEERGAYVQSPGSDALDASALLALRRGYGDVDRRRVRATIDAVRRELSAGPLVYRCSGMEGEEGAFVACSFWLVESLAMVGSVDQASELMEQMLAQANGVGLYAEEIEPATGEFLGNFPQGLSHLALVMAATAVGDAWKQSVSRD